MVVPRFTTRAYAILKNLIKKYPSTFSWTIPVPGDWHLLKCASETIKDMLWEGGLSDLCKEVKHMKELTRWKDIHRVLSAVYVSLLHEAVSEFSRQNCVNTDFHDYIYKNMIADSKDTIAKFWYQTLYFLNAYFGHFFAICSGNLYLWNSCLPALSKLFFAYTHNKYEQLACETIYDNITASDTLLSHFRRGEWTVSIGGRPFHNVALDEGHEMIINKCLKELTSRPSEYRTVTLANLMAYLDKFMDLLQIFFIIFFKRKNETKTKDYEYTSVILNKFKEVKIFASDQERKLSNIFKSQHNSLTMKQFMNCLVPKQRDMIE